MASNEALIPSPGAPFKNEKVGLDFSVRAFVFYLVVKSVEGMRPLDRFLEAAIHTGHKVTARTDKSATLQCGNLLHPDKHPSVSISEAADGRVLMNCHSRNCSLSDIIQGYGLEMKDLFPEHILRPDIEVRRLNQPRREVTEYDYQDAEGNLSYQVMREEPKNFKQRRPNGRGGWINNLQGIERIPFNLPELIQAVKRDRWILIVEGEKDVLALKGHGLAATCNSGGAGKWEANFAQYFSNAKVCILPDNDEAGRDHALKVAQSLLNIAREVHILQLPNIPQKGDVSDWFDRRGSVTELKELVNCSPSFAQWKESQLSVRGPHIVTQRLGEIETEQIEWLVEPWLPKGELCLLTGAPGVGKSLLAAAMVACVSKGVSHEWGTTNGFSRVLIIDAENAKGSILAPRLRTVGSDLVLVEILDRVTNNGESRPWSFPADTGLLRDYVTKNQIGLVVIDTLSSVSDGVRSNQEAEVRKALRPLTEMCHDTGVTVLALRHMRKGGSSNPVEAGIGSIGYTAATRHELVLAQHPDNDGHIVLAVIKSNLGEKPPAIEFRIKSREVEGNKVALLAYVGQSSALDHELTGPTDPERRTMAKEVRDWLIDFLSDGEVAATVIESEAAKIGFSKITLRRAKVGFVDVKKHGYQGISMWSLKDSAKGAHPTKADKPSEVEHL